MNKDRMFINDIMCNVSGHRYIVVQTLSQGSNRVDCQMCKQSFLNVYGKITVWDKNVIEVYENHGVKLIYKHYEMWS